MIRNVVLVRFKQDASDSAIDGAIQSMSNLRTDGMQQVTIGRDLGLREGNAGMAIVSDFTDENAYRAYDTNEEHNRIRRELIAPIAERVDRCQFQL